MNIDSLESLVIEALHDIKAKDIEVISTKDNTDLFERIILASGESSRQVKALANNVQIKAKSAGLTLIGVEGEKEGNWVLIDLGDIVVHVMQPAVREYYQLEELWKNSTLLSNRKHEM